MTDEDINVAPEPAEPADDTSHAASQPPPTGAAVQPVDPAHALAGRALNPSAQALYSKRSAKYMAWCATEAAPWHEWNTVAAYLAYEALGARTASGELLLDEKGRPVQRPVSYGTIAGDFHAIKRLYSMLGLSPGGDAEIVRRVLAGIRRTSARPRAATTGRFSPVDKERLYSMLRLTPRGDAS